MGHRLRPALQGHVRVRDRRARQRPGGPGPRPAGHQAALPRPDPRAAAVRVVAARAAGRRRRRHVASTRVALVVLHDLPLGGAGAAHDPQRRAQAAAGHGAGRRGRTARTPTRCYWDPPFTRDDARADWSERDWQDALVDSLRTAVAAAHGGRRAGRRAALRRHRLVAWSSRCWPRPGRPGCRRSASASTRPAASPATSSSTPTWSRSASAPTTTASRSTRASCCRPSTARSRR